MANPPVHLRTESMREPLGLGAAVPRLSWKLDDDRQGARQSAYRILAADPNGHALWDSGRVDSDASIHVPWGGAPLASRAAVEWRVKVWDQDGEESGWSAPARFELGLLHNRDWAGASWISNPPAADDDSQPAPYFRGEFALLSHPRRARLFATALGAFEIEINGTRVGEDVLVPGWTEYATRVPTVTYDVTDLVREGANAIGAIVGDGWYCGYLGFANHRQHYGKFPEFAAILEVEDDRGAVVRVVTDGAWRTGFGAIRKSDLYHGETHDATLEPHGWSEAGFEATDWVAATARPIDADKPLLVPKQGPAVRRTEQLAPISRAEPAPGVFVYDFGQNFAGRARLRLNAPRGTTVRLRHAEMLEKDGTLYTANLRSARATDEYVCAGTGDETFEPRFTFHGFRYLEVTGLVEPPSCDDVTGVVLHTDLEKSGSFSCSSELVNRLQGCIEWGLRSNFLEVPTDCPQRDERLGWTGDAQVFVSTACLNRDVEAFFEKWMTDMRDAQEDGAFPHFAPTLDRNWNASAAWADAGVIVPWTIYERYGDRRILEDNLDAMAAWVDWQTRHCDEKGVPQHTGFGDWLAIDAPNPGRAPTPTKLIAGAYYAHTADLVARAASVLGRDDIVAKYREVHAAAVRTFRHEWTSAGGRVVGNTQTGYLLALGFDLLPEELRPIALRHLVDDIAERGWHLSTGFVGTPFLNPVLTRFGREDVAFRLLLQETYPSWLYPVLQGATTVWERWNSYTHEHGFGDAGMNSFNHYAYGAIGTWMVETVAGLGLDPEFPGYKRLRLRPKPGHGITHAEATLETPYGTARAGWRIEGDRLTIEGRVPPNATALLTLPSTDPEDIDRVPTAEALRDPDGRRVVSMDSGEFRFAMPWRGSAE
ncbi:MAG: family 78 glycoside hydrolase catalytic domain [Fimbriimonadaceae bacterium]|nr:family 78 glycoside hydrolase catalytic domain [Fimbriimonadaceae bacterium]